MPQRDNRRVGDACWSSNTVPDRRWRAGGECPSVPAAGSSREVQLARPLGRLEADAQSSEIAHKRSVGVSGSPSVHKVAGNGRACHQRRAR